MRDFLIMAFIAFVGVSALAAYEHFNPKPPQELEVVYFGSTTCGSCKVWRQSDLPAWRRDPASRVAPVALAEVGPHTAGPWSGGYGRHHDIFIEAFGGGRRVSWPSFVVLKDGEVDKVYVGRRGWQRVEERLRREEKRRQRWAEAQG
jgi:hypothetical protein